MFYKKKPYYFLSAIHIVVFISLSIKSIASVAAQEFRYIFVDSATADKLIAQDPTLASLSSRGDELSILKIKEAHKEIIASKLHAITGRCGNFTDEGANFNQAQNTLQQFEENISIRNNLIQVNFLSYPSITRQTEVNTLLPLVKEASIRFYIDQLSSYPTRFYQSAYSYLAVERLAGLWKHLIRNRSDAKVELFGHPWKQPSLSLTIKGKSNKKIVIGGHIDSINNGKIAGNAEHAPGADDDASGVSTITEIIRVLTENNYQPENTILFYAYAAEEIGLLGSDAVASKHKANNSEIISAVQLDMTNYKGSSKTIYFDDTNGNSDPALNMYLGSLIDEYLKQPWGYLTCGYACSDHASWIKKGFASSFPFEAESLPASNPKIHSPFDKLDVSGNSAAHSVHFAKLGISYILEMDKP